MRVSYNALLIAVAVLVSADTSSGHNGAALNPNFLLLPHPYNLHQNAVPTSRFLGVYNTEYEERVGLPASVVEQAKATVMKAVTTKKLASWLNKRKPIDAVFIRMQLTKAGDKLFETPQFFTWLNYADDLTAKTGKEASAIATLTAHYDDEALAKILLAAKKVKETEGIATRLEVAQMQRWLAEGNTADDVFKLLKLDKAGDDLLTSPLFNTLNTYVQIFNKENPTKKTNVYATLAAHHSDDALARMILAAKNTGIKSETLKRIEATQIQTWLGSKQTPYDVFKLLKLDDSLDDVLTSPLLNTWVNYLKVFNNENPSKETTLIATLTTHFGDEAVAKMLDAAKKVETTRSIATNLEAAQIQHWLGSRKSPDSVFTLLNLDKAGDDLLASPLFTTFTKFTDAYHAKNLASKMTTGWIVRAHYDDIDVVKMILAAEKVPSSAAAAKRMEAVLFKDWMAAPKAPDHAFEMLKLGKVGAGKLFKDPMFLYWMKFMDDFNKAFPGMNIQRTELATTFKDKYLWRAIEVAKKNPTTEELATKLQTEMLKQFIFAEKQPIDVAKLMNVREKTDANWKLWKSYLKDYNKYHLIDFDKNHPITT